MGTIGCDREGKRFLGVDGRPQKKESSPLAGGKVELAGHLDLFGLVDGERGLLLAGGFEHQPGSGQGSGKGIKQLFPRDIVFDPGQGLVAGAAQDKPLVGLAGNEHGHFRQRHIVEVHRNRTVFPDGQRLGHFGFR